MCDKGKAAFANECIWLFVVLCCPRFVYVFIHFFCFGSRVYCTMRTMLQAMRASYSTGDDLLCEDRRYELQHYHHYYYYLYE